MLSKFKDWLKCAGVRAIKTVCQTAIAVIGTQAVSITEINWIWVASASALAGIISLLTSAAGLPELENNIADMAETEDER